MICGDIMFFLKKIEYVFPVPFGQDSLARPAEVGAGLGQFKVVETLSSAGTAWDRIGALSAGVGALMLLGCGFDSWPYQFVAKWRWSWVEDRTQNDLTWETKHCSVFSESFLFQTCLEAPAMNGWLPQGKLIAVVAWQCSVGMLDPSGASATKLWSLCEACSRAFGGSRRDQLGLEMSEVVMFVLFKSHYLMRWFQWGKFGSAVSCFFRFLCLVFFSQGQASSLCSWASFGKFGVETYFRRISWNSPQLKFAKVGKLELFWIHERGPPFFGALNTCASMRSSRFLDVDV